jgi:hypothetical protein
MGCDRKSGLVARVWMRANDEEREENKKGDKSGE